MDGSDAEHYRRSSARSRESEDQVATREREIAALAEVEAREAEAEWLQPVVAYAAALEPVQLQMIALWLHIRSAKPIALPLAIP